MANAREQLQSELETLLGCRHVYFQPPPEHMMEYPAIRYKLSNIGTVKADNKTYKIDHAYELTYVTEDPESSLVDQLLKHFEYIRFGTHYIADGLNHYTFTLYY